MTSCVCLNILWHLRTKGDPFVPSDLSLTGKSYFQDDGKEPEPQEDDPWAGLPYTVDLETGKLICDILFYLCVISYIYIIIQFKKTHLID